jgi:hypothetical protein
MGNIKETCLELIVQIWDDKLKTYFNSIRAKCDIECKRKWACGGLYYVPTHSREFDYKTITMPYLSYGVGMVSQFMHTQGKVTFECNEVHIEIHQTYHVM